MARILVTSAGYRGDVLPFVSVSRELAARGHEIDLVVPSGFHDAFADGAGHAAPAGRRVLAAGALRRAPRQVGSLRHRGSAPRA